MVNQDSSAVKSLFMLCLLSLPNVALFQAPTPTAVSPQANTIYKQAFYYTSTENGDLGVRISYESYADVQMHVIISYDTEADAVKKFFTSQLTETVFEKFNKCNLITMFFLPCSLSKFLNGALFCPQGPNQCNNDRKHACIASIYNNGDREVLAKFVICTFSGKTIDQCISESDNKISQQVIDQCVQSGNGDNKCNGFHEEIDEQKRTHNGDDHPAPGNTSQDAITNFVQVVCAYLNKAGLSCDDACK